MVKELRRRKRGEQRSRTKGAEPARALVDKVAKNAYGVTDEDVAAAKSAGLKEDEIFELVVCAAIQSTRQIENALAALEQATNDKVA